MAAKIERRLAAIMAADIVGYSRLMEADEAGTIAAIKGLRREIIDPLLSEHNGRVAKLMGDGAIIEFGSVVDAVTCGVAIQERVATRQLAVPPDYRIVIRIGINLGDVVAEDGDLLGDGVNIAARLESLAEPGGILISSTVRDHLRGGLLFQLRDLGDCTLKNIARPIHVYAVAWGLDRAPAAETELARSALPSRASIAVLPFTNMSSDPEQEFFAEGLAEDLITDLSKVPGLLVIARNSSFTYKARSVDIRSVARELGVRYVVEGSVRRVASRVRINAQLIDAMNNSHIWADRFDRDLADVFVLQDEVVEHIVKGLASVLPSTPRLTARRPTVLAAYDILIRGRAMVTQSAEGNRAALPLLERAIQLDPNLAEAHAWLAMSHHFAWAYWLEPIDQHPARSHEAAQRAVFLDPQDALAHAVLGDVLIYNGRPDQGRSELETALGINPNHADAWTFLGQLEAFQGHAVEGIDDIRRALRLNPYPPGWYFWLLGLAQYAACLYEDAVETLKTEATRQMGSQRILAASLAQLGRIEEAREEAEQFVERNPNFSMEHWARTQPFRHEADRMRFLDGYTKAGLPA